MQELAATTVVLADDHAIVREGIAALCTSHGMRVLGQVADGGAAVEMIEALKPDFAILDLHMPGVTGVEAIRRLRTAGCTVKLMILSISREEGTVMEALRAGADAYLLKDGPARHLLDAISFVRDGGVYVSPMLRGAGLFAKAEQEPSRGPAGRAQSAGNGGLLLSGERAPRQGYRRPAGDQPQDGRHLPRQPDAQTERSRPGGAGEVCDRAQPYDDISAAVGSARVRP